GAAGRSARVGRAEPAAPVGAEEGFAGWEEEAWFVVNTRSAASFEMILPDGDQLWDPELRGIDEVLKEEALLEPVEEALRRRRPKSGVLGRPGTPAVVLRMLVLKHLYDWSYRECEREVRGSLVYRAFCQLD